MGHTDVKTTEIYTHVMEKDLSSFLARLTYCQVQTSLLLHNSKKGARFIFDQAAS